MANSHEFLVDPLLHGIPNLKLTREADLSAKTTMKMNTRAALHVEAGDIVALQSFLRLAKSRRWPVLMLGGGSNTLFATTHFEGIVLSLGEPFRHIEKVGDYTVRAGAAVPLTRVLNFSNKNDLMGIEFCTMIPGQFGGALAGNAGANKLGVCEFVERVACMTRSGRITVLERGDFRYKYRYSELREAIVLEADLRLEPLDFDECHARIDMYKAKKVHQPYGDPSAGCIFKNPRDPRTGEELSAGKLIDDAGLKGYFLHTARVSDMHANFIVNKGGASGEDFLALISLVQDIVQQRFGIRLQIEVQIVGGPMSSAVVN